MLESQTTQVKKLLIFEFESPSSTDESLMSNAVNKGRAGKGRGPIGGSFERAMWMLRLLSQSNGLSAGEILSRLQAEGLKSSEKRVREVLRKIQNSGIGIWEDQGDLTPSGASRWKIHVGVRIGEVLQLNRQELLALYLSRQSLLPLKETAIYRDFESAFTKIDKVLGRPEVKELRNLETEVHFANFQGLLITMNRDVVDAAHAACAEGHVLECTYFSPERKATECRRLGPHFMTFSGGALYLFAEDLADKKLKTFSLSRMTAANMLASEEYTTSRMSYQEAFGNNLGMVRGVGKKQKIVCRFQNGSATYVRERVWHPSQVIEPQADGSIRFEMTVSISSLLVKWLLGFEDSVEILEPTSLREQVVAAAEAILKVYKKDRAA